MEVNPELWSSTMYSSVPSSVTTTITVVRNTRIFRRASRSATHSTCASDRKPTSFSTRKTRRRRSTRIARRCVAPGTNDSRKVGTIERRSTTPKKESAYASGRCTATRRSAYSTAKRPVNESSAVRKARPYSVRYSCTLSASTVDTLARIATSSDTSNTLPPSVSASKITSCSLSRSASVHEHSIRSTLQQTMRQHASSAIAVSYTH